MASSLRLVCRKGLPAGTSSWFNSTAHTLRRMSTAATAPTEYVASPWMKLPPSVNGDTGSISYNFYSLADDLVRPVAQKELTGFAPNPIHDLLIRGSSHGWLAMFNRDTLDLFLYDPITLRRINLPPIHNLPNHPKCNMYVHKLILSCSPDEDEHNCRAVTICNSEALAFCCPGRSKEWTPISKTPRVYDQVNGVMIGTRYTDIAYSTRQNLFFCLHYDDYELEAWDLSDPSSPRMIKNMNDQCSDSSHSNSNSDSDAVCSDSSDSSYSDGEDLSLEDLTYSSKHLVVADGLFSEDQDDALLVTRYVVSNVAPDGSFHKYFAPEDRFPDMTIGFDIDVYDREEGDLKEVDSLGDLAIFIGSPSESVTLSATRFPELRPNSIYFTDTYGSSFQESFGGHDIGIFDYGNRTVSPCYYPCDVQSLKKIVPSPIWFYPRGPV